MTSHDSDPQSINRVIFHPETIAAFAAASHGHLTYEQQVELADILPTGLTHEEIETFGRQQFNLAPAVHVFEPEAFQNGQQDRSGLERRGLRWLAEQSIARGDLQTAEFTVHVLRQKQGLKNSLTAYRLDRIVGKAKDQARSALMA